MLLSDNLARTSLAAAPPALGPSPSPLEFAAALAAALAASNLPLASRLVDTYPHLASPVAPAYVAYRLGRYAEALRLSPSNTSSRGLLHVRAQTLHQQGHYAAAAAVYRTLAASPAGDDATELATNLGAAVAMSGTLPEGSRLADDVFNHAVGEIVRGNAAGATDDLRQARASGDAALAVAASVQEGYLERVAGEPVSNPVDVDSIADPAVAVAAATNQVDTAQPLAPILALSGRLAPGVLSSRLLPHQQAAVERNYAVAQYRAGKKVHGTSPACAALAAVQQARVDIGKPSLANAAALRALARKAPNNLPLALQAAQAHVDIGEVAAAATVLEHTLATHTDGEHLLAVPGLTGPLLGLYRQSNQEAARRGLLERIAAYYSAKLVDEDELEFEYVKSVAFEMLPYDRIAAIALLQELTSLDLADSDVAIAAVMTGEGSLAEPAAVDVAALEARGYAPFETNVASARVHKHRKRGPKLPKRLEGREAPGNLKRARAVNILLDADASKVDPERWLPLKDRQKGRKGKGKLATQGSASDDRVEDSIKVKKVAAKPAKKKKGKKK